MQLRKSKISEVLLVALIAFILEGCAASYKPFNAERTSYSSFGGSKGIGMQYQQNVLRAAGNKKLANKEDRRGVFVVAIEVTNQSNKPIKFYEDVELFSGDTPVRILSPDVVYKEIHQVSGLYMLWSILWVVTSNCENGDCTVTALPLGAVIGLINFGIAKHANKMWKKDIDQYNLMNKTIEPGETVTGLIGIPVPPGEPLTMRLKSKE